MDLYNTLSPATVSTAVASVLFSAPTLAAETQSSLNTLSPAWALGVMASSAALLAMAYFSHKKRQQTKHMQQYIEMLAQITADANQDQAALLCELLRTHFCAARVVITTDNETRVESDDETIDMVDNSALRQVFNHHTLEKPYCVLQKDALSEYEKIPKNMGCYVGYMMQSADKISQHYLHLLFANERSWSESEQQQLDLAAQVLGLYLRDQATSALVESNSSLADSLIKHLPAMLAIKNREGQYININAELEKTFALEADGIIGLRDTDLFDSGCAQQLRRLHNSAIVQNKRLSSEILLSRGLRHRQAMVTAFPLDEAFIPGGGAAMVAIDITARRSAERALMEVSTRYQIAQVLISDGLITLDADGCIEHINPVAQALVGLEVQDALGQPLRDVLKLVNERDREPLEDPWQHIDEQQGSRQIDNAVLIGRHQREYPVQVTVGPLQDKQQNTLGAVVALQDATRMKQLESAVDYQKHHDQLTGLENRHQFSERLDELLQHRLENPVSTLCYLDIDQFKVVNDSAGHGVGDIMLREIAELIGNKIRANDALARLGGDEFALLLHHCDEKQAIEIASELVIAIEQYPFRYEQHNFRVSASIGIVSADESLGSASEWLTRADVACFTAKENGRNQIHVYQPSDASSLSAMRHDEIKRVPDVRAALDENRFELYAQPILPIHPDDSGPKRFELLVRMLGESGEVIVPGLFLPAAERYGLMIAIDRWVISHAFSACAELQSQFPEGVEFGINLSGVSLGDPELLAFVIDSFKRTGLDGRHICFEITETAAISNIATARRFVDTVSKLGCTFALDDFGTGLSSFGYLKTLPVDYLKIDGSFVRHIAHDEIDHAMVSCIQRMSKTMGIKTIAEFVENQEIMDYLEALGVDYAQGHLIGRAEPLSTLYQLRSDQPSQLAETSS